MINNRRTFVALLAACVCFSATTVFAGGGGNKRDSTIRVENESNEQIGILINPTDSQIQRAQDAQSVEDFVRAGGRVVNDGGSSETKVRTGDSRVIIVLLSGPFAGDVIYDNNQVSVEKGETRTLVVHEDGTVDDGDSNN